MHFWKSYVLFQSVGCVRTKLQFRTVQYQTNEERRDPYTNLVRVQPHKFPTRKKSHGKTDDPDNVDFISSNVHSSRQEALLYIL